jgi:hypothetical protein
MALTDIGINTVAFEPYQHNAVATYVECFDLELESVVEAEVVNIKNGRIQFWHSGIPCKSLSILQALNKYSSRTVSNPWGDGRRECEVRASQQVRQLVKLFSASVSVQCQFSIEQPASSLMLKTGAFEKILSFPNVQIVYLDQCCYGLRPPDYDGAVDNRVRKRTAIVTNLPNADLLARKCQKDYFHIHAIGHTIINSRRVKHAHAAQVYPPALCRRLAALVASAWQ